MVSSRNQEELASNFTIQYPLESNAAMYRNKYLQN